MGSRHIIVSRVRWDRFIPLTGKGILDALAAHPGAGREQVRRGVAPDVSPVTVWRAPDDLSTRAGLRIPAGRATGYSLAGTAVVRAHLRMSNKRQRLAVDQKEFIDRYVPNKSFCLGEADGERLHEAGWPVPAPSRRPPRVGGADPEKALPTLSAQACPRFPGRVSGNGWQIGGLGNLLRVQCRPSPSGARIRASLLGAARPPWPGRRPASGSASAPVRCRSRRGRDSRPGPR